MFLMAMSYRDLRSLRESLQETSAPRREAQEMTRQLPNWNLKCNLTFVVRIAPLPRATVGEDV